MAILEGLVTDKTDIILLDKCDVSNEEKTKVIDLKSDLTSKYIKNMYLYKGSWCYFKKDGECENYYYSIVDELVGSRLASGRNLPTVSFKIARLSSTGELGIISPNFKQEEYKYEVLSEIIDEGLSYKDPIKLELLSSIPCTLENKKVFLTHLFNLFALDIHMLQKDRADVNLQFQTDLKTGFFDIAPLYDYATCASKVNQDGINIPSKITRLDYLNIISLARRNPIFRDALEYILEEDMVSIWNEICEDNNFDMDGFIYNKVLSRLEEKEISQKQYIKELLSRV